MFKLIKIQEDYILTDGIRVKVSEDENTSTFSMGLLGATMKIEGSNVLLIDFDKIDPFILDDNDEQEWEVEMDNDFNIYLKTQTF